MNSEARHDLRVLEAVAQDCCVTQRTLATKLGMALGLTNIYIKRLVAKGYIECVTVQSNRLRYLVTPTGLAEKTRLTYEFMQYSLGLYRETRRRFGEEVRQRLDGRRARVAIYGAGDAAELAYLCLKEIGVEPVAVFDGPAGGEFLGIPVRTIGEQAGIDYDVIVVATIENPAPIVEILLRHGIAPERFVLLREPQ